DGRRTVVVPSWASEQVNGFGKSGCKADPRGVVRGSASGPRESLARPHLENVRPPAAPQREAPACMRQSLSGRERPAGALTAALAVPALTGGFTRRGRGVQAHRVSVSGRFEVLEQHVGRRFVIAPSGEIDLATVGVLDEAVTRALESGAADLWIDLAK